jgi:hypothetical protein
MNNKIQWRNNKIYILLLCGNCFVILLQLKNCFVVSFPEARNYASEIIHPYIHS